MLRTPLPQTDARKNEWETTFDKSMAELQLKQQANAEILRSGLYLSKATGAYRGPFGSLLVFMTFADATISKEP